MKIITILARVIAGIILLSQNNILPISIGNNTAVNNFQFFTFPKNQQNRLFGFFYMQGGFSLEDSTTTCTFDAKMHFRGSLALNGGTLYVTSDMIADNSLTFTSMGNIIALGNYSLTFPDLFSSIGIPDSKEYNFHNLAVNFNSDVLLYPTLKFTGTMCQINGNGNTLDLGSTGSILVDSNSVLKLRNLILKNVHSSNVRLLNDNAVLGLDNVTILQDESVTFSKGSIIFDRDVNFVGSSTFNYASARTSTVNVYSHIVFNDGTTLNIGRATPLTTIEPLFFSDHSSVLHFDNSHFRVSENGINLTNGTLTLERQSTFNILSTSTTNGLSLGNGSTARNMLLKNFPAATVTLLAGHFLYNDTIPNAINSGSTATRIIRGNSSVLHIAQNAMLSDIQVDAFQQGAHITFNSGKTFRINNVSLRVPNCTMVLNCYQTGDTSIALQGNDSLDVVDGTMPLFVSVSNSNNLLTGGGDVSGVIVLANNQASLLSSLQGTIFNSVTMNGGTLKLSSNLSLGNDTMLTGSGTVDLGGSNVNLGRTDLLWTGSTHWKGSGSSINLNADVWLDGTWTLTGEVIINGGDHTLDLRNTGNIIINPNSTIILKNIRLKNIKNANIKCLDNTSTLILNDVDWEQSDDYTFDRGSLIIEDSVSMHGEYIFVYQSAQTSTINERTQLMLDEGFTFSYDPIFVASDSLINFVDKTSHLILNGATLHATVTGMTLTKGSMIITDNSVLASEIRTNQFDDILYNHGIVFGANSSANDFTIDIAGGYELRLIQGLMAYRNVNATSFSAVNGNSTLFIDSSTELDLWYTLNLGVATSKFGDNATLGRASGADLIGTVIPLGNLNQISL